MKHLVIIGAGGFGREMYGAALGAVGYGAARASRLYLHSARLRLRRPSDGAWVEFESPCGFQS